MVTAQSGPLSQKAKPSLHVRDLGLRDYNEVFHAMREFTDARSADTADEFWFTQHPPVFTQGQAGRSEFILAPGDIPVVQSDRGGQVTYHGPGQIVGYLMLDLRRLGLTVRELVNGIESAIVALLAEHGIEAVGRTDARGVYVGNDKIAALGLRIRRGCSYHGLALNVDMDLEPFSRINPCGLTDIGVTMMSALAPGCRVATVQPKLARHLREQYGFEVGST
ncbi:MAG: lipoyl(octanoyl) transferase LipB [Gammaproteobacteria bacterium]|nr:lipoyl(octanoyl) transferase LipB [Gammaproteobacteria bacterium]